MLTITNEDNMQLMARYPDKYFDLAIVDPPYGINAEQGTNKASRRMFADKVYGWDNSTPPPSYFKELLRVSKNQIVWGGNYFLDQLGNTRSFIIWDKLNPDRCFSDCEFAWASFDKVARIIKLRPQTENALDGGKIHPTQKPVKLYKNLLDRYAEEGFKILDTHLGSGSIAIACHDYGYDLTACELDQDYYQKAMRRITDHRNQLKIAI